MGFALFTASGTFNPIDYGLTPGDQLWVVVVGGGGGGSARYNVSYGANGGTGGTSSFGSYLTALGGSGGSYTATRATQGTFLGGPPTNTKGDPTANGTHTIGGGGAGGWLPGYDKYGGDAQPLQPWSSALDSMGHVIIPAFAGYSGAFAFPAFYHLNSNSSTAYYPGGFRIETTGPQRALPWTTNMTAYNNTSGASAPVNGQSFVQFGQSRNNVGLADSCAESIVHAGNGSCGNYYYDSWYRAYCVQSAGGVGYGAGGAAAGVYYYNGGQYPYSGGGWGGNSGEIKMSEVRLTSVSSIAVTVGGGGSGANGFYNGNSGTNYFAAGKNGSAGAAGASTAASGYTNAGGYGSSPHGKTPLYTYHQNNPGNNTASQCAAGGGGAGGCVAIWW